MSRPAVGSTLITKVNADRISELPDLLAAEEPMEIRLGYGAEKNRRQKSISVTMRTPGNDFELALGFLFTEGIIKNAGDIIRVKYCTELNRFENQENIVRVGLNHEVEVDLKKLERHFYTSSSCGVCGKASIDSIEINEVMISDESHLKVDSEILSRLTEKIKARQNIFEHTGGLHAAALFSSEGELILIREDVGRHNALDKLIGAGFFSDQLPFNQHILLLSGRASFELIQKAAMAGIKIIAAIGAPSTLAVETAKKFKITLIGFLRGDRFNIYSEKNRIKISSGKLSAEKILEK
jgi:FdhD protein